MKYILIVVIAVLLIGGGVYYFISKDGANTYNKENTEINHVSTSTVSTTTEKTVVATSTNNVTIPRGPESVIGKSASGNDIKAYHFGKGKTELMFIGGIHGGYSANTSLVAFEMIDLLKKNPSIVPENLTVTIIPIMNPDGLKKVTGTTDRFTTEQINKSSEVQITGRFNGTGVDLNRNFDCEWQSVGTWQNREVSGGKSVFSEPESQAIRDYVTKNNPKGIVTWYSAEGSVYPSACKGEIMPETSELANLYAEAAKYKSEKEFDHYALTGDMVNWFASKKIPAISVLLTTHDQSEWEKNQAGVEAIIKHYTE